MSVKEDKNGLTVKYNVTVDKLIEMNPSFDKGILRIAHSGGNRNNTFISKKVIEDAIPTIFNCPIVCNYNREEDSIGGHDVEIIKSDEGARLVNITQPVGVIPESAEYWWEIKEEDSGEIHEYFCIEGLIWKRQEAYNKIKNDKITDLSMEIDIKSGEKMADGYYHIHSFSFLALCLLERDAPCFKSANLEMYSIDEFKALQADMMRDFKECFSKASSPDGYFENNKNKNDGTSEGGVEKMKEDRENTYTGVDEKVESIADETIENDDTENAKFSLTSAQLTEELCLELNVQKIETRWGYVSRYLYFDHDAEKSLVYCFDRLDDKYILIGLSFSMNGDKVIIDFNSGKRMKTVFVDFDEGVEGANYSLFFESYSNEIDKKISTEKDNELKELQKFKAETLENARKEQVNALFARFEELNGTPEFESLKGNYSDLSIDEIEEKCFAILGRVKVSGSYSLNNNDDDKSHTTRLPVATHKAIDEPYGGIFEQFSPFGN